MLKDYNKIKKSQLFENIKQSDILPNDIIMIITAYLANYTEKYINNFGHNGNGKKNLIGPRGMFATEDELYIVDSHNRRIQVFDHIGKFIRSWQIDDDNYAFPIRIVKYNQKF